MNNTTIYYKGLAVWTPLATAKVVIAFLSLCLNASVVIVHLAKPSYITHFTIYLLALFIANTFYLASLRPLQFYCEITRLEMWMLGRTVCIFTLYLQRVVSVVPVMAHVLIALNRFWALRYPISYRTRHNRKMASLICLGMVCYVHFFTLPAFLLYLPHYYQIGKCEQPAALMVNWWRVENIVDRIVPLFVILGLYIYIFVKRLARRRELITRNLQRGRAITLARMTADSAFVEVQSSAVRQKVVKPFLVLTLTAVGVLVCWLPLDVYFFCTNLGVVPPATARNAVEMLFLLQNAFDPLMWIFSLRKTT